MESQTVRLRSACLLIVLAILAGCATMDEGPWPIVEAPSPPPPPPPPTAALDEDGWIAEDAFYEKTVSYATSRVDRCAELSQAAGPALARCEDDPRRLDTGNERTNDTLAYGTAIVRVPLDKPVGGTEGMALVGVVHDIAWDRLLDGIAGNDLLVFVHGYNTAFSSAAIRAAQLAHDTNFRGAPVLFSWPSNESLWPGNYQRDQERAQENGPHLADFLQGLAAASDRKIHVVAHSMGTLVLMNALVVLDGRLDADSTLLAHRRDGDRREIFSQVILAAPDIAQSEFGYAFDTHELAQLASRITLYSADNDHVLDGSRVVNLFINGTSEVRLGDSSKAFFVVDGMDTIDTRQEISPQFFGHSFYANYRSLVADMHLLLTYGADADGRMLQRVADGAGNALWFIRD